MLFTDQKLRMLYIRKRHQYRYYATQIASLDTELATKESELVQERQIKEDLFRQASSIAQSQDTELINYQQVYDLYYFI